MVDMESSPRPSDSRRGSVGLGGGSHTHMPASCRTHTWDEPEGGRMSGADRFAREGDDVGDGGDDGVGS